MGTLIKCGVNAGSSATRSLERAVSARGSSVWSAEDLIRFGKGQNPTVVGGADNSIVLSMLRTLCDELVRGSLTFDYFGGPVTGRDFRKNR